MLVIKVINEEEWVDLVIVIGMLGVIGFVVMVMVMGGSISMFVNVFLILIVFGGILFVILF